MKSSKALYNYFEQRGQLSNNIIVDLFGYLNWTQKMLNETEECIILFVGLYKGLYLMDVTHQEIHRYYLNGKLDELIHNKYSIRRSKYYKEFCDKNIIIGKTIMDLEETNEEM